MRLPLFSGATTGERVAMEWWRCGAARGFSPQREEGLELFVVAGVQRILPWVSEMLNDGLNQTRRSRLY